MNDKQGMDKDDIFFFCDICGNKLTMDNIYYQEDGLIWCNDCYNDLP